MALKLMPFGLAKRLNPIAPPEVLTRKLYPIKASHALDCSHLASIEAPPTVDLSRLGGGLARFTHLPPSQAISLEHIYLLKKPKALSFPGLLIMEAETQLVRIPALEIPLRDSIALIPEADVPSDNFLIDPAETTSDALDDGLTFIEPKVLSEDFLLAQAKVKSDALDDGLAFPKVEIVEVSDYLPGWDDVTIVVDALNGDAFLHPSKVLRLRDGLVFTAVETEDVLKYLLPFSKPTIMRYVNFLEVPEIISSPFKLMTSARTVGKDYRSHYAPEEDEKVGRQTQLPGLERKCRHGVTKSQCSICLNNRVRAPGQPIGRQPHIVDVFEQLFYILQPPILPVQGQPLIFPNGKTPYPFQVAGVKWLVERESALLADEMGLGKTIQAIIAMRILFRRGELQRTLVVCPASMTNTWEREIRSWAPELRIFRLQGDRVVRTEAWKSHAEIYVVSYETLRNDIGEFESNRFDLCVLDEAQKIKNPGTKTHRSVIRLMPQYRWALTGTPMENKETDVVALFGFIKPGLFYEDNADWYTKNEVRLKMRPYLKRRTIEDVDIELPELTHQDHWLDLLPSQRKVYDATENQEVETLRRMGTDATRIHVFALITKLKQICNYEDSSSQSCKLSFLEDELQSLVDNNDKALVFSQYPGKTLKKIEPKLQQFAPLQFDGSLSTSRRDQVLADFQESDINNVLLMSARAGGQGLTLTRANHVFHFDHWWNPAVVDQASARVYRIGQKKPVFIHSLYAADTIEERIFDLLQQKRAAFHDLFGQKPIADDGDLNSLTDKDLYGLFGLPVPDEDNETPSTLIEGPNANHPPLEFPPDTHPVQPDRKWQSNLYELSPTEFEEAIRDLFRWWKGFLLHTTKASDDGGIDLDGYRLHPPPSRVVVQCKRYKGTVSVGKAREFYGAIAGETDVGESYLVTTSKFSNRATRYARRMGINLIAGEELSRAWGEFLRQS